ncbi:MAG: MDR family MFS transporter [Thermomicrobiales bacterium]
MATTVAMPSIVSERAPFQLRTILAPLVALVIGAFMIMLDSTAMNVAVPGLVGSLHSTLPTMQWTITGYALAQAAVIPLAGWLSDRWGARRIFLGAVVLFTLGSVLCATAKSDTMLIACRVLQGLGGGVVLPIALAYTYRLSPPDKVGMVIGLLGIPITFAPALGPVMAGWLVEYASWHWIFLLNLPIGVAGLLVGLRGLPALGRQRAPGLDLPGMLLGPLAFAALSYGVSEGSAGWTSARTLGGLLVGGVALVAFVLVELRARTPLLELRVFQSRDFSLGIAAQWACQFALYGTLFLVPLFLQQARGYGAFATGLLLLPEAIAAAIGMPLGGALFDRIGVRPLVVMGMSLVAAAALLLSRIGVTTQGADLIGPLALVGVGVGLMMMTLNTHLIQASPRELVGRVTSLTNALVRVVTALAIASLTTILTARTATYRAAQGGLPAAGAAHTAFSTAIGDTFRVLLVVAVAGAALGLGLRRPLKMR